MGDYQDHQLTQVTQRKLKKGPAKPVPNRAIRTDGYKHWPEFCKTKGDCRNPECKGILRVKSTKCDVRLCFTTNPNSFKRFHK